MSDATGVSTDAVQGSMKPLPHDGEANVGKDKNSTPPKKRLSKKKRNRDNRKKVQIMGETLKDDAERETPTESDIEDVVPSSDEERGISRDTQDESIDRFPMTDDEFEPNPSTCTALQGPFPGAGGEITKLCTLPSELVVELNVKNTSYDVADSCVVCCGRRSKSLPRSWTPFSTEVHTGVKQPYRPLAQRAADAARLEEQKRSEEEKKKKEDDDEFSDNPLGDWGGDTDSDGPGPEDDGDEVEMPPGEQSAAAADLQLSSGPVAGKGADAPFAASVTALFAASEDAGKATAKAKARAKAKAECQCQIKIGIEEDKQFRVVRRLIGGGGMKNKVLMIHEQSLSARCNLRLRGRGSRFLEGRKKQESTDPLELCITCDDQAGYEIAKDKAEELVKEVQKHYRYFCQKRGKDCPDLKVHVHEGPAPHHWC